MKFVLTFALLFGFAQSTQAALAPVSVPDLVAKADYVVVGTLVQSEDKDGEHRGHVQVARVIRGEIKEGAKIPVRWRPKPANLPKGLEHTADYVYAPPLDKECILIIQPQGEKDGKEKARRIDWGSTQPLDQEAEIEKMAAEKAKKPDDDFIGKTKEEAMALAAKRKIKVRVVKEDGESFMVTADYREDRINLTVEKGKVVAVRRG